jgi:hypothetical protein
MCLTGLISRPLAINSSRAASRSATHSCRPSNEPGTDFVRPLPIVIEQAEPGGVSWTTRTAPISESTSTAKPHFSL